MEDGQHAVGMVMGADLGATEVSPGGMARVLQPLAS